MRYIEPKMNISIFAAENVVTSSGSTGDSLKELTSQMSSKKTGTTVNTNIAQWQEVN